MSGVAKPPLERFSRMYEVDASGCWLWKGYRLKVTRNGRGGYGTFAMVWREKIPAHLAAWLLFRGPIPDGMVVRHRCDVRACVNPDHLELGTYKDNTADMYERGRACAGDAMRSAKGFISLTEDQVRRIRARYAAGGVSQTALGEEFGVSQATISRLLRRKTYGAAA